MTINKPGTSPPADAASIRARQSRFAGNHPIFLAILT